ncbi:MAG: hypothetical protein IE914_05225 [Thiotrichales bacterium]|nr:hypothetical protein [Thiotrichales bacterium]
MKTEKGTSLAIFGFVFFAIAWFFLETVAFGEYSQRFFPEYWPLSLKAIFTMLFSWFVALGVIEIAMEVRNSIKKKTECQCKIYES